MLRSGCVTSARSTSGGEEEGHMETMELLEISSDSDNGYDRGYGQGGRVPDPAPGERLGRLPAVLESLLLAAGAPVPIARLVNALQGPGRAEVQKALEALRAH